MFYFKQTSIVFILIILLIVFKIVFNYNSSFTFIDKGIVLDIKESYYIVKNNKTKVILYSNESLNYYDEIEFSGKFSKIKTLKSVSSFSFEKYNNQNNIFYQIKADQVKIIKKSNTFISKLNTKILKHDNSHIYQKIILQINHSSINDSVLMFIFSSRIIIRSLISLFKKLLDKLYYEKQVFIIEMILYVFMMFTFRQYAYYLNIIIYEVLKLSKLSKFDQICLSTLILLFIFPNYLFNLTFQISFLYRLAYFIKTKDTKLLNFLIIIPFNLRNFYKFNIFEVVFYPLLRYIGIIIYLFSFVDILFNTSIVSYLLAFNFDINNIFIVSGYLNNPLLIIWIYFSLNILSKNKMFDKLMLVVILIINQNQLLFSPILSYTQLYVGQGDSAIIKYPYKRSVLLIDSGPAYSYSKLSAHLNYYGIKNIHSIIISHDDSDHSGNLDNLIKDFNVLNVCDKPINFYFYDLEINLVNYVGDNDNDSSLISFFKVNDITYLSLGDVSSEIEKRFLLDYSYIKPNIIKLAHHGSNTSTSKALLELDSITLLINSSGLNNPYHHPHYLVLKRIYEYNLAFIDTQNVGDIEIKHFYQYNFINY